MELVAYININGRPSKRERSERRDSDVHGARVYWPMGVIKFAGGTIRLWGCRGAGPAVQYGGILGMYVRSPYDSVCPRFRVLFFPIYVLLM